MNAHKLTKLSSKELSLVNGGQIYAAWDKKEQKNCYLVPSVRGYAKYYNATDAKLNSRHLPRNNIVNCSTLYEAAVFAESDCVYYQILNCYQD